MTNTHDTTPAPEPERDICAVCGDDGPDHRNLRLRCFSALQEISPKLEEEEDGLYFVRICKACRADFLEMLGKFCRGELRKSDTKGANIPVRIGGTTRMLTLEEYDEWKKTQ